VLKEFANELELRILTGLVSSALLRLSVEGIFSRRTIIRNFNPLVDKEDYTKNEKKEIIAFLAELSKRC